MRTSHAKRKLAEKLAPEYCPYNTRDPFHSQSVDVIPAQTCQDLKLVEQYHASKSSFVL